MTSRSKKLGRGATIGGWLSTTNGLKFGVECFGCHQRIKPLTKRYPVKTPAGVVFFHNGCRSKATA